MTRKGLTEKEGLEQTLQEVRERYVNTWGGMLPTTGMAEAKALRQ